MIHIYHHIWTGGPGLEIAQQQKNRLFDNIKDEFIYHPNIVKINENECYTLLKLMDELKLYDVNDYILYIHNKGATKPNETYEKEWREYMELSLIDDYKSHLELLQSGFDTSGILNNYKGLGPEFIQYWGCGSYGGNFWWAKINSLRRMTVNIKKTWGNLEDRHMAEWCFLSKIHKWNPGILNPPIEQFNNFYQYVLTENEIAKEFFINNKNKTLL